MNKFKAIAIFAMISCMTYSFAQSLQLQNDSPFLLDAIIINANGKVIGRTTVSPNTHITWTYQNFTEIEYANKTSVPYTVIWYCHNGGNEYGIWTQASPGSRINAQGSTGSKLCKMENEKKLFKKRNYNQQINDYSQEDYSPDDELNTEQVDN
ncbi:MAG: hypothetical protein P0S95_08355 [Rhabdochlamydiaceae bacterium]|nr:hypothetical protein [Candidatus Amphrikana amoebophyrae]